MSTLVRLASCYMSYPGNCCTGIQQQIDSLVPMGPNYMGEVMWPVSAQYKPETDTTWVGFTLIPPPDFLELMAERFGNPVRA